MRYGIWNNADQWNGHGCEWLRMAGGAAQAQVVALVLVAPLPSPHPGFEQLPQCHRPRITCQHSLPGAGVRVK
jgi:hypothetical protein